RRPAISSASAAPSVSSARSSTLSSITGGGAVDEEWGGAGDRGALRRRVRGRSLAGGRAGTSARLSRDRGLQQGGNRRVSVGLEGSQGCRQGGVRRQGGGRQAFPARPRQESWDSGRQGVRMGSEGVSGAGLVVASRRVSARG